MIVSTDTRPEGHPLKPGEWRITEAALRDARLMVSRTANRLAEIYNCLLPSSDPKRWTPVQKTTVGLFRHHFKSDKAVEALQVQQAYRLILGALNALQQTSFQVVSNAVARRESDGDGYAYVRGDTPPVYLAEFFFNEPPAGQSAPAKGKPRFLTAVQRARILIHETAHFKLGVGHRGGNFGFEGVNCAAGHAVRSFEQAYDNAYVYDFLAYCASQ
jgi:hypothetical protein